MRGGRKPSPPTQPESTRVTRVLTWVVAGGALIIPLFVSMQFADPFRAPKDLLIVFEGLILAGTIGLARLFGHQTPLGVWPVPLRILVLALLAWTTIVTITATNLEHSIRSSLLATASLLIFVVTYNLARSHAIPALLFCLVPACLNSVAAILQRTGTWALFRFETEMTLRDRTVGFLGNPNFVGSYLVIPAIAAAAIGVSRGRYRWVGMIMAAIMFAGVSAAETAGAVVATAAGLFCLFLMMSRRNAIIGIALLVVALIGAAIVLPERWQRLGPGEKGIQTAEDVCELLSHRLPAYLAAWEMFARRPVTGVGLGCFASQYFDQKLQTEERYASFLYMHPLNFGEVHNEHLQLLAEGGLPLYVLFLATLVMLGRRSFVGSASDERALIGRSMALPIAVATAVLAMAHFPLRLPATIITSVMITALVMSWTDHATD